QLTAKGDPSATYRADAHRLTVTWARYRFDWSDRTVTAQLQLSDDGTIDLHDADVDVITPTAALTIGFESAGGGDAYTYAHRDLPSLSPAAWRFRPVATAAAAGVVRNASDGRLIAGATVTADPGGRSTITDQ